MTVLKPYNFTHFHHLNYGLDEVQIRFTATVSVALERIRQRNLQGDFSAKPIAVLHDGLPVGFFILDFGKDKLELSENKNCVLLRSFSINPKFQQKGIGKAAVMLVPDFVKNYYPQTDEIVLAVNEANENAFRLYKKCGYDFEGKTRMGLSGRQFIMVKKLGNQEIRELRN